MPDAARRIAGFNALPEGINFGIAPNLLDATQAFFANNVSFRGDLPETRPPFANQVINNPPSTWMGLFQGSTHYDAQAGQSGWLIARGGRFFYLTDDTFTMKEVTPQLIIVTAQQFSEPGPGNNVAVPLNGNPPVTVGQGIKIAGTTYTVFSIQTDQLTLTQVSASLNVVPANTVVINAANGQQLIEFQVYPANQNFVFMFQAEMFVIVLGGQQRTLIFDGKVMREANLNNELPSGIVGAYGWGRIWIALTDGKSFIAGDLVGGPLGTQPFNFRDSILKVTENTFLNEGGSFSVPANAGPITAMQFLNQQNTATGQGVLLVGTTNMIFSVNAPVDRTTWKNLQYPIQTIVLFDYGPLGPRSTVPINGDMWYRSEDGIRSFANSIRNFPAPGNVPMSHEVDPILDNDTEQLLFWSSGMLFDNKWFLTFSPYTDSIGQVLHRGLVVINFDLLSTLAAKSQPAYEGINTGLQIFQAEKCRINNVERAWLWVQGEADVELWEVLADGDAYADQFTEVMSGAKVLTNTAIQCTLQTRAEGYGADLELKRLIMGEMYVEDVADTVSCTISYKPDAYPNWIPWISFTLCAKVAQCTPQVTPPNCFFMPNARTYAARLTLPAPQDQCNGMTAMPAREFHDCQFQLQWTGHWRIRRFFTHIKIQTQPMEGTCPGNAACIAFPSCGDQWFGYDSHGAAPLDFIAGEAGEAILSEEGELILPES